MRKYLRFLIVISMFFGNSWDNTVLSTDRTEQKNATWSRPSAASLDFDQLVSSASNSMAAD